MKNIITIDLEDWHQLAHRKFTEELWPLSKNIVTQTNRLLDLLDRYNTKATFFVLGLVAENNPQLIRTIFDRGHEIACHGYRHELVKKLSPEKFKELTNKSKLLLENIIGNRIVGYRAAEFSINKESLWALEILAELGFGYDSSIFPIYHRRYGISDFNRKTTVCLLKNGNKIIEIPLSTFKVRDINLPISGGGYFRLLPSSVLYYFIKKLNSRKENFIGYFHPYEVDEKFLNSFDCFTTTNLTAQLCGLRMNVFNNIGRKSMYKKVEGLLKKFSFIPCREFIASTNQNSYNIYRIL
jgi:polysaccharide deacetylase family protein (PEP-CTERM system associated)